MMIRPLKTDTIRLRWLAVALEGGQHGPRWRRMLNQEELARADRFVFEADRAIFTAAHALARFMASEATGLPTASWGYGKAERGKPVLLQGGQPVPLQFNISHTNGMVCCAIAHHPIGVDVEASDRRLTLDIADRFFAPEEVRLLYAEPPPEQPRTFFRFWTLKESFIKTTGEGLNRPLDSFSFSFDPIQVRFHPDRDELGRDDDPALWRFWEFQAAAYHPVALAVRCDAPDALRVDADAVLADSVAPT